MEEGREMRTHTREVARAKKEENQRGRREYDMEEGQASWLLLVNFTFMIF